MPARKFIRAASSWTRKRGHKYQTQDADQKTLEEKTLIDVRTQFVRNVAHRMDLDSLVNTSLGLSSTNTVAGDNIPDFVEKLFVIGNEYNRKMRDVIDYARVCNGGYVSVEGPLLVRNVLSSANINATDMVKKYSDAEPLVHVEIDRGVPISELIGDGPAITGILQELIFNGLRHSFDDEVFVRVWPDRYVVGKLYFSVENSGVLVDPSDIPYIFEPFTSTSTSEGNIMGKGVGIGLAKSKKIADILRAELDVKTKNTTVFTLGVNFKNSKDLVFNTMPLDINRERFGRTLTEYAGSDTSENSLLAKKIEVSLRVLVVDDSPLILRMFDTMMSRIGIDVDVCSEPLKALQKIVEQDYDAIFLDVIMPVMTGITCAQEIRKGDTRNKNTPIIVVTADMSTETRQLTSYISDSILLEKPARLSVLTRSLMSVVQDKNKCEYLKEYCE